MPSAEQIIFASLAKDTAHSRKKSVVQEVEEKYIRRIGSSGSSGSTRKHDESCENFYKYTLDTTLAPASSQKYAQTNRQTDQHSYIHLHTTVHTSSSGLSMRCVMCLAPQQNLQFSQEISVHIFKTKSLPKRNKKNVTLNNLTN